MNEKKNIQIGVKDGEIDYCRVVTSSTEGGYSSEECTISGIDGKIYKIVEFGEGHDNSENQIGLIMTDGTVYYLPLFESVESKNYSVKGKLKTEKHVIDAFSITAGPSDPSITAGGYGSTVFVFDDGSYVKYDKSML